MLNFPKAGLLYPWNHWLDTSCYFLSLLSRCFFQILKHIMHLAVLFGLLGFLSVLERLAYAVAEMNWLKGEPYGIIHASMLKPFVDVV